MAEATRDYRTESILVRWNPERCIHSGYCVRGLPEVFNPQDRPWVHLERASADEIAEVVQRCPTGALHFERLDGGPQEPIPATTTVTLRPNGPLYVRGDVEVLAVDGSLIRRDTRVALCRCGHSAHKPFCDGSHRAAGFRAPGRETHPEQEPDKQAPA
jgi:uncharacterized Fe-S cluster protein YjdI/CDGSH-type Zn-finger protein